MSVERIIGAVSQCVSRAGMTWSQKRCLNMELLKQGEVIEHQPDRLRQNHGARSKIKRAKESGH